MPTLTDPVISREIMLDHYSNPNNKKTPENINDYQHIRMDSTSCIDDITIYAKIKNGVIQDCLFDGVACVICTSSTDIMCDLVKGKTIEEATSIINEYLSMIYEKPFDEDTLEEAVVFKNTYKQAARIKCATLGWNGLNSIITGDSENE